MCLEKLSGPTKCPTCRESNPCFPANRVILFKEESSESSSEEESDTEESDDVVLTEEPSALDRVMTYLRYCAQSGEGKAIIAPHVFRELGRLDAAERTAICQTLANKGFKTFLANDTNPWCICVVLDDTTNQVPPIADAQEIHEMQA